MHSINNKQTWMARKMLALVVWLLSGETLLQAKKFTGRRWDSNPGPCRYHNDCCKRAKPLHHQDPIDRIVLLNWMWTALHCRTAPYKFHEYSNSSSASKRANRTRFTDYQIKTLQDYFEQNAYPKDEELEQLSRALSLPNRVIVVWFQNARQKARKVKQIELTVRFSAELLHKVVQFWKGSSCCQLFSYFCFIS